MRHGFKAQAERISLAARTALAVGADDAFDPWAYAEHLGIVILDFKALDLGNDHKDQLTIADPDSWSGLTLKDGDTLAIVLNPAHAETRQRNTLSHELSHAVLRHSPAQVHMSASGMLVLSDYAEDQEDEADWLAAALLMPREALLRLRGQGKSPQQLASHFKISPALCEWRLRMTGIDAQLRRRRTT